MLELKDILILTLAAFGTSILSAIVGFGGGFILIAVLTLFFEVKEAVILSVFFFLTMNTSKFIAYKDEVDTAFVKTILVGIVPGIILGLLGFYYLSNAWVAYILIAMAVYIIIQHYIPTMPQIRSFNRTNIITGGFFLGLFSGLSNAAAIKVALLKWKNYRKEAFVGTGACISLFTDISKFLGYIIMGVVNFQYAKVIIPIAIVTSFAGTYTGKRIIKHVSVRLFDIIMISMMMVLIIRLLVKEISG